MANFQIYTRGALEPRPNNGSSSSWTYSDSTQVDMYFFNASGATCLKCYIVRGDQDPGHIYPLDDDYESVASKPGVEDVTAEVKPQSNRNLLMFRITAKRIDADNGDYLYFIGVTQSGAYTSVTWLTRNPWQVTYTNTGHYTYNRGVSTVYSEGGLNFNDGFNHFVFTATGAYVFRNKNDCYIKRYGMNKTNPVLVETIYPDDSTKYPATKLEFSSVDWTKMTGFLELYGDAFENTLPPEPEPIEFRMNFTGKNYTHTPVKDVWTLEDPCLIVPDKGYRINYIQVQSKSGEDWASSVCNNNLDGTWTINFPAKLETEAFWVPDPVFQVYVYCDFVGVDTVTVNQNINHCVSNISVTELDLGDPMPFTDGETKLVLTAFDDYMFSSSGDAYVMIGAKIYAPDETTYPAKQISFSSVDWTSIEDDVRITAITAYNKFVVAQYLTNCSTNINEVSYDKNGPISFSGGGSHLIIFANPGYQFNSGSSIIVKIGADIQSFDPVTFPSIKISFSLVDWKSVGDNLSISATAVSVSESDTPGSGGGTTGGDSGGTTGDTGTPGSDIGNVYDGDPDSMTLGFISVYNPTPDELSSLSEIIVLDGSINNMILKAFRIFVPPLQSDVKERIQYGSYVSFVYSYSVKSKYITANCGEIFVPEAHSSSLDYSPNVDVQIWLPFIGFVNVDTADVMNRVLALKYRVNVLNGDCIALLFSDGIQIGAWTGSMCEDIPFNTNNATDPKNTRFGIDAVTMGGKTPFVLIKRKRPLGDDEDSRLDNPSEIWSYLEELNGYTVCSYVDMTGIPCTCSERAEIEAILRKGVLLGE